jgi:putative transposase
LRFASRTDWASVTRDMKAIYTAPTVEAAETGLLEFTERWASKYPAMVGVWERAWPEFVPFSSFPVEIRKLIYTTNAIESLNARFWRATRRRGHLPNEQAALKVLYLTIREKVPSRTNPVGKINGWKSILNALTIHYGDRLAVQ